MPHTYAKLATASCPMSDDNCFDRVVSHIEKFYSPGHNIHEILETTCGRYVRGKNKGKLKGWAHIVYATVGGWVKTGDYMDGFVARPNDIVGVSIRGFNGETYFKVGYSLY